MASLTSLPTTKVGILSLGDMGAGIARLLLAKGFPVATNCQGRSEDTVERARKANVEILPSDLDLVQQCDLILSVVPPRDAEATAQRIIDALSSSSRSESLYFADLNAVAPSTCRTIAAMFEKAGVPVRFIDGCLIGIPPMLKTQPPGADNNSGSGSGSSVDAEWIQPTMPISGPHSLLSLPDGERLAAVLKCRIVSPDIGAASGLKMCFTAMSKGFAALIMQTFTTAEQLGMVGELRNEINGLMPSLLTWAERWVPQVPPKAYRFVREMEEVSKTMSEEGGWDGALFDGTALLYRAVAEDEVLGKEKIGNRTRGADLNDVVAAMAEGLERKKKEKEKEAL